MQKERPGLNECSPSTSSKKDKDGSSRGTEQAACGPRDNGDSSKRGCNSEKDSGYSDNGSDWQHTDVEDQRSKVQSRGSGCDEIPLPGQKEEAEKGTPGSKEFQPIYIIKNVVLKPPDMNPKRGQVIWRTGGREMSSPGPSHVILLQQPNLAPTTAPLLKAGKSNGSGKTSHGSYLPILKSYPRIAPHPGKKPAEMSSSGDGCETQSKRVCNEHTISDSPTMRSLLLQKPERVIAIAGQEAECSPMASDASTFTTASSSSRSHTLSGLHTSSFLTRLLRRHGLSGIHNRRLLNTLQILRRSGLLNITLRTKQMLRQSTAIDRDIAQLRGHAELLCQAANSHSEDIILKNLHRSMTESGCYPSLQTLNSVQMLSHAGSTIQRGGTSPEGRNGAVAAECSDVPQYQPPVGMSDFGHIRFAPHQSRSRADMEHNANDTSETVAVMPPDSSTG